MQNAEDRMQRDVQHMPTSINCIRHQRFRIHADSMQRSHMPVIAAGLERNVKTKGMSKRKASHNERQVMMKGKS
jgi:hypothetical protein